MGNVGSRFITCSLMLALGLAACAPRPVEEPDGDAELVAAAVLAVETITSAKYPADRARVLEPQDVKSRSGDLTGLKRNGPAAALTIEAEVTSGVWLPGAFPAPGSDSVDALYVPIDCPRIQLEDCRDGAYLIEVGQPAVDDVCYDGVCVGTTCVFVKGTPPCTISCPPGLCAP